MANTFNQMGEKAEWIVGLLLNRKIPTEIFRVKFLGDKWPALDFYVELTNHPGKYFFIQVKATTRGYLMKGRVKTHLQATVKKKSVIEILKVNAPTFLIALDYQAKDFFKSKGYILSLHGDPKLAKAISAVPTNKPLTPLNLKLLEKEVVSYWNLSNCMANKHNLISKFI